MNIPGTKIKKPKVTLTGEDGNAFFIIGKCARALRRAGAPPEVVDAFKEKARSGTYDTVLSTAMEYCEVD